MNTKVSVKGVLISVIEKEYNGTPISEYIVEMQGKFGPEHLKFEKYDGTPQAGEGDTVEIEGYAKGRQYTDKTGNQNVFLKIALSKIAIIGGNTGAAPQANVANDNEDLPF
jgi:hypothetical protein